jgi:hypothetical protein
VLQGTSQLRPVYKNLTRTKQVKKNFPLFRVTYFILVNIFENIKNTTIIAFLDSFNKFRKTVVDNLKNLNNFKTFKK